jgi:hypothetical protein
VSLYCAAASEAVTAVASTCILVTNLLSAGDTLVQDMLKIMIEQHELDAAQRKCALDEAIASLPPQVLLPRTSRACSVKGKIAADFFISAQLCPW